MRTAQFPNTSCDIGRYFKSAIVLATVLCASSIAPYQRHTIDLVDNKTGAFSDGHSPNSPG
jgi:hypothetical protein